MKYIIILILFFTSQISFCQVGINTSTPKASLHVYGSTQLTNNLLVNGNSTTSGNSGNSGEILTSQGAGSSPIWSSPTNLSDNLIKVVFYSESTGASSAASSTLNVIPGLTTSYTATNTGLLEIEASVYSAIAAKGSTGGWYWTKVHVALQVNGETITNGTITNLGNTSNYISPNSTYLTASINVTKGNTYAINVLAADEYNTNVSAGSYAGSVTYGGVEVKSAIYGLLIPSL